MPGRQGPVQPFLDLGGDVLDVGQRSITWMRDTVRQPFRVILDTEELGAGLLG